MHSDYLTQCLRLSSNILVLEGNGKPLQSSCLENPMDRGAWQATVLGIAESDTLKQVKTHTQEPDKPI